MIKEFKTFSILDIEEFYTTVVSYGGAVSSLDDEITLIEVNMKLEYNNQILNLSVKPIKKGYYDCYDEDEEIGRGVVKGILIDLIKGVHFEDIELGDFLDYYKTKYNKYEVELE